MYVCVILRARGTDLFPLRCIRHSFLSRNRISSLSPFPPSHSTVLVAVSTTSTLLLWRPQHPAYFDCGYAPNNLTDPRVTDALELIHTFLPAALS